MPRKFVFSYDAASSGGLPGSSSGKVLKKGTHAHRGQLLRNELIKNLVMDYTFRGNCLHSPRTREYNNSYICIFYHR